MTHPSNEKIAKVISEKFTVSLMSDTKWKKLITGITSALEREVFLEYKLVHSDEISQASFVEPDFGPFFIEPIIYKEVQWIEFLSRYEDYVSEDNKKAGTKVYEQDIGNISKVINSIGQFEVEETDKGLRLYAYK